MRIMGFMKNDYHIDEDLFEIFVQSGVYKKYAKEYVKAQWMMLQQEQPDDYVIATGKCYSIREFAIKAFEYVGIEIVWKGNGLNEVGIDKKTNKT